jgi:tRNA threonylcarbamoyladenosine biosynthesis protein TsaE
MTDVTWIERPEDWQEWAAARSEALSGVVALVGGMGAGKTTAVGQWLKALGSPDRASSPTFALVNEYESPRGPIYHFDLHRLDRPDQVAAMGFEDYVGSGQPCWVEWPDRAGELLPDDAARVVLEVREDGARKVTFVVPTR